MLVSRRSEGMTISYIGTFDHGTYINNFDTYLGIWRVLEYDHFKKKILAAKHSHFIDEKLELYLSNENSLVV